jgi:hypothetical protein
MGEAAEPERVLVETREWGQRGRHLRRSDRCGLASSNTASKPTAPVCHRHPIQTVVMAAATDGKEKSLYCQKCKQPVRIDPSLEQLNPASYDLLVCVFLHRPLLRLLVPSG